jgi:hypothetical protein
VILRNRPCSARRDEVLRRADGDAIPSQGYLRPGQGIQVPLGCRRHLSHPSLQPDRSGRSRLAAQEVPAVRHRPCRPWAHVAPGSQARPSHRLGPSGLGGPERPLVLWGLPASRAAGRPIAWPACSLGLRARQDAPMPTACGERWVLRHAPSSLVLSVLLVWSRSCLGFVP